MTKEEDPVTMSIKKNNNNQHQQFQKAETA